MIFKATFVPAQANAGHIVNKKAKKLGAKDFLYFKAIYKDIALEKFQSEVSEFKTNPVVEFSLDEAKLIPAFDHVSTVMVTVGEPKAIEWAGVYHAFSNTEKTDEIEIKWHLEIDRIKKYWADNGYKTNI